MHTSIHKGICILILAALSASAFAAVPESQEPVSDKLPNRPKVPGTLRLHLRERKETTPGSKEFNVVERTVDWEVSKTAVVIVDMWDGHYCRSAAQRIGVMVPRMNADHHRRAQPWRHDHPRAQRRDLPVC